MKEFALMAAEAVARCAQDSASQALSRCFGLIRCEGPDRSELHQQSRVLPCAGPALTARQTPVRARQLYWSVEVLIEALTGSNHPPGTGSRRGVYCP